MRPLLLLLFAFFCGAALAFSAEPTTAPSAGFIDKDEVLRRGDAVVHTGDGPEGEAQNLWGQAIAMPEDDSGKWTIWVIGSKNCKWCEQLKRDWRSSEHLLAWANPNEPKTSWGHYHEFDWSDPTQGHRWQSLGLKSIPVVILKPPLNGRFGPPDTIVVGSEGYAGPEQLARKMARGMQLYLDKFQQARQSQQASTPGGFRAATDDIGDVGGYTTLPWQSNPPMPTSPPSFEVPPASALPATPAEIRAHCPGCDQEFVESQLNARATLPQAQSAWSLVQSLLQRLKPQANPPPADATDKPKDGATTTTPPADDSSGLSTLISWGLPILILFLGAGTVSQGMQLWMVYRQAASAVGLPLVVSDATVQQIKQAIERNNNPAP